MADFSHQWRPRMGKTIDIVIHGTRADNADLRAAVAWAREAGHVVRAHVTWEGGDGERLAAECAARRPDAVLAAGGDGTVNEVVNGLRDTGVAMGIVPVGTANDFARQAGIPTDPREALALVLDTTPVAIDLGELNGRAFLNVSTAGIGAETTAETAPAAKEMLGPLAYALVGMKKLLGEAPERRARFIGPGFALDLEYLVFAVGNAQATGSGVAITPLARANDGLLDVCVVGPVARASMAPLFLDVRRGEHLERDGVHYVQTPWLRVESDEPVSVNVDGEPCASTVLEYRVLPAALRVHVATVPGEAGAASEDAPDAERGAERDAERDAGPGASPVPAP